LQYKVKHKFKFKTIKLGMFSFSAGDNGLVAAERMKGLKYGCNPHPLNAGDLESL